MTSYEPRQKLSTLALAANATVVHIAYRASSERKFPGPIHDVLAGYDWVVKHLGQQRHKALAYAAALNKDGGCPKTHGGEDGEAGTLQLQGIGVCGEFLGGSLAAALALTECCSPTSPWLGPGGRGCGGAGVRAVFLSSPVVDWTAMYDAASPQETRDKDEQTPSLNGSTRIQKAKTSRSSWVKYYTDSSTIAAAKLLSLRKTLFRDPADSCDPFASPLLFFRTPSPYLELERDILLGVDTDRSIKQQQRRARRQYPPTGSNLMLPHMKISVGESVLRDQVRDFADAARKSVQRDEGQDGGARIEFTLMPTNESSTGMGGWGEKELFEAGMWFAGKLG